MRKTHPEKKRIKKNLKEATNQSYPVSTTTRKIKKPEKRGILPKRKRLYRNKRTLSKKCLQKTQAKRRKNIEKINTNQRIYYHKFSLKNKDPSKRKMIQ